MEDKRLNTSSQLLDRGVRFRLPAPVWLRWLRPSITIKSLKAGTILCFSEVVLKNDLEKVVTKEDSELLAKSINPICECIAISALNSYWKIKLFKKMLTRYLLWQVDSKALMEIFMLIVELNNPQGFTITTKWYVHQMKRMMNPNLGQPGKGS